MRDFAEFLCENCSRMFLINNFKVACGRYKVADNGLNVRIGPIKFQA